MEPFGILVKSYRGDHESAQRLFASIQEFNVESLPVWVVVPDEDRNLFEQIVSEDAHLLTETHFTKHLVDEPVAGIRPGYINQEIIKLAFWEMGLAANYLPVDSDAVFLRPFHGHDFMYSDVIPYTVLLEDRELQTDAEYFRVHWQGREQTLREIQREVGLDDRRLLTCHGHQVLSSTALASLRDDFLRPRGWDYARMLAAGPYEFSWYNFWVQKSKVIPLEFREPYFKVIHSSAQHEDLLIRGVTMEDIARGYLGVIVNSNFAKSWSGMDHRVPRAQALAQYMSWSQLFEIMRAKAARTFGGK